MDVPGKMCSVISIRRLLAADHYRSALPPTQTVLIM